MFHAYRYRLEYSGRREWGKFAIQICLWHRSTNEKPHNLSKRTCCRTESSRNNVLLNCTMLYSCLVSFEVLQFSNENRDSFLPAKKYKILVPRSSFSSPEPLISWSVISAKTLGTRIPLVSARGPLFRRAETTSRGGLGPPKFFGTRAEKFAFTRQKSSGPCPILLARVPKFRSAVLKMNVV